MFSSKREREKKKEKREGLGVDLGAAISLGINNKRFSNNRLFQMVGVEKLFVNM